MKYSKELILILLSLFLVCQFFGLFVIQRFLRVGLPYGLEPPEVEEEVVPWYIISVILLITFFVLIFQRLRIKFLLKLWFTLAITICISISLSAFIEEWVAFLVALMLVSFRLKEKELYIHNLTELLCYGGAAAIFAPIFNVTAMLIILAIISLYDIIAVWVTKHMVTLAKTQQEIGVFSGLVIRYKDEFAILGGGDIVFPLLFASTVLLEISVIAGIFVVYGAVLGLLTLALIGERKKYYPALPFITSFAVLSFVIGYLLS
jgi:presenilin-like A22 family membrane protease